MNLTPKHWAEFQHYKDRAPVWIKLHRKLLDDFAYSRLPLASRALAPMLWLLASEYEGGKITATVEEIAFRLRVTEEDVVSAVKPLIEAGFFDADSDLLATCEREAIPEKRREENIEKRREETRTLSRPDEKFEEFKKGYPRRKGANPWKPARAQWDILLKAGCSPDHIMAAAKAGIGYDPDKIGTEYIPQAVKWLRDRRFDDYSPPSQNGAHCAKFYAAFGSPELDAWDAYERAGNRPNLPRDRKGGWYVNARWPPGYVPEAKEPAQLSMAAQ